IINAGPAGDQGTMASPVPLVWEAVYGYGAGAIDDDTWQTWDTTSTSSGSGWWSTRGLGTICSFNCFVDWTTVLEQNPSATIVAMGVNVGSGPGGSFVGATDAFAPTLGDETIIYDFDVVVEPESKDDCKKG